MKPHHHSETDSLYIELKGGAGVETREIADGLNADLDAEGGVVGLDMDRESARLHLPSDLRASVEDAARRAGQTLDQFGAAALRRAVEAAVAGRLAE